MPELVHRRERNRRDGALLPSAWRSLVAELSSSVRLLGCLLAWPRADPYRLNEVWQRRLAEACLQKRVSLKAGNEAVGTGPRFCLRDSRYMPGERWVGGVLLF